MQTQAVDGITDPIYIDETLQREAEASPAPGDSTLSVHLAHSQNPYHAISEPIVHSATYTFADTADLCQFMNARLWEEEDGRIDYGRYGNPTVAAAEARLAALEGAQAAILFPSGMSAITNTLLALLESGDHLVITSDVYRQTRQFCQVFLKRLGIECTVTPVGDYTALEAAIGPRTKLIFSETPTNPYLRVLDLERLAEIASCRGILTLVDTTFATPLNLRPLEWGINLVIHSGTKYLAGHNDLLSGAICGDASTLATIREALKMIGSTPDPNNAWLLLRGLKSLALRLERQNRSGQLVAEYLESHPAIEQVWYPGLASHPDHLVAIRQMKAYGGVVSFTVNGDLNDTSRFIDALRIPLIATSLGGAESLVSQPALMAYYELSSQQRRELGIQENLVRLALGIEDTQDLIADLGQALSQV
jgi:cystathionine gamma-synthase